MGKYGKRLSTHRINAGSPPDIVDYSQHFICNFVQKTAFIHINYMIKYC